MSTPIVTLADAHRLRLARLRLAFLEGEPLEPPSAAQREPPQQTRTEPPPNSSRLPLLPILSPDEGDRDSA